MKLILILLIAVILTAFLSYVFTQDTIYEAKVKAQELPIVQPTPLFDNLGKG